MIDTSHSQREMIKASHLRSLNFGVQREQVLSSRILSQRDMDQKLKKNRRLIEIASPFMQLLSGFVSQSGFMIMLTDGKGCILELLGDHHTLTEASAMGMIQGAYMAEQYIGTNAMGTALAENKPVQITAREHYVYAYQLWTCAAAPIHDEKGRLIGCLNLTAMHDRVHAHTLGLIVASVKAIEHQVKSVFSEKRLKEAYRYVSQILNTLEFGVISTNDQGVIHRVNNLASRYLRLPVAQIESRNLATFIPQWEKYLATVQRSDLVVDEEITINHLGDRETFNLNVYPLTDGDGTISGTVVTIREMKRVYKIVHKYTGMQARYNFEDLIGESDELKKIIEYCKNIASSPSTVLIQGESGTGKEVLAQSVHNYSNRRDNGFVALNCGAIPEALIESELFGYTEGAFTSARKGGKPGKFELANGGTLFLDEIGEMPMDMQVKLLRALQEKAITRVGGEKLIPVDVRIIAASNRNLKEEITKGNFRQDLYYRLSVIPVYIPPLKDRREDIPILIRFFLNLKSVKLRKQVPDMDNRMFKALVSYDWPGNVRELENFIEKYVNLDGQMDLNDEIMNPDAYHRALTRKKQEIVPVPQEPIIQKDRPVINLDELEKQAIEHAIIVMERNMTKVSKALGISRNALYQKVKKYGISL